MGESPSIVSFHAASRPVSQPARTALPLESWRNLRALLSSVNSLDLLSRVGSRAFSALDVVRTALPTSIHFRRTTPHGVAPSIERPSDHAPQISELDAAKSVERSGGIRRRKSPASVERVLMVNYHQAGGGAGRAGAQLAHALRDRGFGVVSYVKDNIDRDPTCRTSRFWRERALEPLARRVGLPDLLHLSTLLWGVRRDFASADLLHLHNLHGDYVSLAALPVWSWAKPMVWTLHDQWITTGGCPYPDTCDRWLRQCGSCPERNTYPMDGVDYSRLYRLLKPQWIAAAQPVIVTPSRWLADQVGRLPEYRRVPRRVVNYAVDLETFTPQSTRARRSIRTQLGLDPTRPTVLLVAHMLSDVRKGTRLAIGALQGASKSIDNLQVLVIGNGYQEVLRDLASDGCDTLAAVGHRYISDRDLLSGAYAASDLTLVPSLADNFPLVVQESLAAGTPVVAFPVGGIAEQVQHGRTGYLATIGDVADLARGVVQVLKPRERNRLRQSARDHAEQHWSEETMCRSYRAIYAEAFARWRRRRGGAHPRSTQSSLARALERWMGWTLPPIGVRISEIGGA